MHSSKIYVSVFNFFNWELRFLFFLNTFFSVHFSGGFFSDFLWILRNFWKYLFHRTPPDDSFCLPQSSLFSGTYFGILLVYILFLSREVLAVMRLPICFCIQNNWDIFCGNGDLFFSNGFSKCPCLNIIVLCPLYLFQNNEQTTYFFVQNLQYFTLYDTICVNYS